MNNLIHEHAATSTPTSVVATAAEQVHILPTMSLKATTTIIIPLRLLLCLPLRRSAMASLERNNTDAALASKACVVCNAYQPRDGKFLSCFHVICAGCLAENMSCDDSVSCLLCRSDTSAKVPGVDFGEQLISSAPILNVGDATNGVMDTTAEIRTPFCDPCLDIEVERRASHVCEDCGDLPLCDMHAEKHPKKRVSSGHRVRARLGHTSYSQQAPPTGAKHCAYHSHCVVVTYCQTCSQCVCAECIAAGSHDGHVMENPASAAERQRTRLTETLRATGLGKRLAVPVRDEQEHNATNHIPSAAVDADDAGTLLATEELLKVVEQRIIEVNEEATAASKTAADRFGKIQEMLKRQSEQIFNDVDQRLRTQLDALEAKKKCLEFLLYRQTAAVNVATRLTSPTISPEVLLEAVASTVENILAVSRDLKEAQTITRTPYVFVETTHLEDIQQRLQQVVRIREGVRFDITKSLFEVEGRVLPVGREGRVAVNLFNSAGDRMPPDQEIPAVSASVILPSGTRQPVEMVTARSDSSKLVFPISSRTPGTLALELSYRGLSWLSTLAARLSSMLFDPEKCSKSILLSGDNRVATLDHEAGCMAYFCALAEKSVSSGRHTWTVKIINGIIRDRGIAVGVSSIPSDGNYKSSVLFFRGRTTGMGCWNVHGNAYRQQLQDPLCADYPTADMEAFLDGDVLKFTLDWKARTLRCVNQRTNQTKTISGIDRTQPLYPAVSFRERNQSVEFLDVHP